jgi:hypothetical protein
VHIRIGDVSLSPELEPNSMNTFRISG